MPTIKIPGSLSELSSELSSNESDVTVRATVQDRSHSAGGSTMPDLIPLAVAPATSISSTASPIVLISNVPPPASSATAGSGIPDPDPDDIMDVSSLSRRRRTDEESEGKKVRSRNGFRRTRDELEEEEEVIATVDSSSPNEDLQVNAKEDTINRLRSQLRERGHRGQTRQVLKRRFEMNQRETLRVHQAEIASIQAALKQKEQESALLLHELRANVDLRRQFEVFQQSQAQQHQKQLEELRVHMQVQADRLQASHATEMETRIQQEVKNITDVMRAEKERELANIKQRLSRLGSPQHVTTGPTCEAGGSNPIDMDTNSRPPSLLPPLKPTPPIHPSATTPALNAIKHIRKRRGMSQRTRLIGIEVEDASGAHDQGAMGGSDSEDFPDKDGDGQQQTSPDVPPITLTMMEAFTKGMQEVICNVFGGGGDGLSPPRRTPRRKKVEDEAVRHERKTEPSQHRDFILEKIRRLFKSSLGISQDIDFITHEPANPVDVHAYEYEDGPPPNMGTIAFDLSQNSSSPWNSFILEAFCRELQRLCIEQNWPVKRSDNYIRVSLRERYKRLRTVWRNAQPGLTAEGTVETSQQTETRLIEEQIAARKESRQSNRRRNKYQRRIRILDRIVALKSDSQEDDLPSWQWLLSLIKLLGEHGMSSEESSVENSVEEVLRVKKLGWRRDIDRELDIVDLQRLVDDDVFSARGARPVVRKRAPNNPKTTRNAPIGLPLALYDSAWIAQLTDLQVKALELRKHPFQWMKVAAV